MRSPVSVLFSTDGVEVPLKDNVALPTDARGFIGVGVDGGGNTQFVLVDTSGRYQIVGAAAEGAATAGNPLLIAGTDGTNARTPHLFDADSGAGAQYVLGVVLRKSASGGSVELGTSSDPVRTDPTGTTTQPISGTVSATQGTAAGAAAPWAVRLSDGSSFYSAPTAAQLPSSLVGGRLDSNIGAWLGSTAPTVGSKTSANSIPVVVASDQGAITTSPDTGATTGTAVPSKANYVGGSDGTNIQGVRVFDADTGGGTQYVLGVALRKSASGGSVELGTSSDPVRTDPTGTTTQPVSGTVTANQGTAAAATAPWAVRASDGSAFISVATDRTTAAGPFSTRLSDGSAFYDAAKTGQLPSALVGGRLDINIGAWLGSTAPTVGQKTMANSLPVTLASNQSLVPVGTYATGGSFSGGKGVVVGGVDGSTKFRPLNADGLGNIGTMPGGTWQASLHSAAALTTSGNYDSWILPTRDVTFTVEVSAVTGTNPALTFFFKEQGFGTGDYEEKVWTLGPITAVGKYRVELVGQVGGYIDVLWSVTGSTPSFTCTSGFLSNSGSPSRIGADNDKRTVHHDSTVTTSGARSFGGLGSKENYFVVNVKNSPTGTTPTLTYTVAEVDPGDQTTVIGASVTSTTINAIGTQVLALPDTTTGAVKVSWVVTGSTPSFTGVFASLISKRGSAKQSSTVGASTNVASSASVVTLLAANKLRVGATIFNDSNQNLFVKLGSGASLTSFTVRVTPNGYYEVPYRYMDVITGIWSSANGNARVTELT